MSVNRKVTVPVGSSATPTSLSSSPANPVNQTNRTGVGWLTRHPHQPAIHRQSGPPNPALERERGGADTCSPPRRFGESSVRRSVRGSGCADPQPWSGIAGGAGSVWHAAPGAEEGHDNDQGCRGLEGSVRRYDRLHVFCSLNQVGLCLETRSPPRSSQGAAAVEPSVILRLTHRVADDDQSGQWVGPPPPERGVERQADQHGSGEARVYKA